VGFGKKLRATLAKVVGGAPLWFALPVVVLGALGMWVAAPRSALSTMARRRLV